MEWPPLWKVQFWLLSPVCLVAKLDHELDGLNGIFALGEPFGLDQRLWSPWCYLVAAFWGKPCLRSELAFGGVEAEVVPLCPADGGGLHLVDR